MKSKYIIAVHSNRYGDCYGGYDNEQLDSGYPTMTSWLSQIAEFDSVERAQKWAKDNWRYLRLGSGDYNLNTFCVCGKRFIPVFYYKG